jgi:arylsulfatase A-like enzyme
MAGDHGRVYKRTFHESALRVPLILRWPERIPSGTVCDALVETIDVDSTLLDALGLNPLQMSLGQSLGHMFAEPAAHHRAEVLSEIFYGGSRNTMVKTQRHKYVMDQHGMGYMLYDMQQDPDEQHNLIGNPENRDTENEMRDALLRRLTTSAFVMDSATL